VRLHRKIQPKLQPARARPQIAHDTREGVMGAIREQSGGFDLTALDIAMEIEARPVGREFGSHPHWKQLYQLVF
jgi:hypothetical protein